MKSIGLDNINDYYDGHLKYTRLREGDIEVPNNNNNCPFDVFIQSKKNIPIKRLIEWHKSDKNPLPKIPMSFC